MKKLLLLSAAACLGMSSFAQRTSNHVALKANAVFSQMATVNASQKTTGIGDTFAIRHYTAADTPALYVPDQVNPFDSGFVSGTNAFGDMSFAERFEMDGVDSSVKLLGVFAYFHGSATASSTKTLSVKAWSQGPTIPVTSTIFMGGKPDAELATASINLKDLRLANGTIDTFGLWWFNTPSVSIGDSFFVGYHIDYTWASLAGDSIALIQTTDGERTSAPFFVNGTDTIINVQNATQFSDGSWNENVFENAPSLSNDYYIYAIFSVDAPLGVGVKGITMKNLTYLGNFPNPASDNTTIKLSLKKGTDVTVDIVDMTGRKIRTVNEKNLSAGEHNISMNVSDLSAGSYIYFIHTAEGDGMGAQMTIVK